ncbi:MAG: hypothetical protein AB199_02705 [Parcubacteria bacterium C7867-004]|nr:MAG: hypothetical protein AB199_02705 [Parcubacteria bacterium C7867-004]
MSGEKFVAKLIGREAKVLFNNAFFKLKPKRYLLVGLNEAEKTYFDSLSPKKKIFIDNETEIQEKLKSLKKKPRREIRCRESDLLKGLYIAKQKKLALVIDENAKAINVRDFLSVSTGILVIEEDKKATDIVAINLAHALNSDIAIVEPFNEDRKELTTLQKDIYKWKKGGDNEAHARVIKLLGDRLNGIDFSPYHYATFFTDGLPYSLVLEKLSISYINPNLRCDLFIFNELFSQYDKQTEGVIVFSPEEFGQKEETPFVVATLKKLGFYVKELIGKNATVHNFEHYSQHYPYDLMHICSHGGQTDGYFAIEKFTDRDGKEHTVEYEEVVGFSPVPGKDLIAVSRKAFFKRFDGFEWMSPELKAQHIPSYIFEDMTRNLFSGDGGEKAQRFPANYPIANSCHIKCYDSIHQGTMQSIALYNHPIIFNNTCCSWHEISNFFITAGARGYIGTLWSIKNINAVRAAAFFYSKIHELNIAALCRLMNTFLKGTSDEGVYMYWGLPFSKVYLPTSENSRLKILGELFYGLWRWVGHYRSLPEGEVRKNTNDVVRFIHSEIAGNFKQEDLKGLIGDKAYKKLETTVAEVQAKAPKESTTSDTEASNLERGAIDLGTEYRGKEVLISERL